MANKVGVKNLAVVTNAIKKYGERVQRDVEDEIAKQTTNIELAASQSPNKPNGVLIRKDLSSPMTGIVQAGMGTGFNDKIAAYIEFGTGRFASELLTRYPKEVQDLARQYYVNGQGRLPYKPYLIPAFLRYRAEFRKNVKKIVKNTK